jgi:hypothetical protein
MAAALEDIGGLWRVSLPKATARFGHGNCCMASASPEHRLWAPHIWQGSDFFALLRLLAKNGFAVDPGYWYVAALVTVTSFGHTLAHLLQEAIHGRRIRATEFRTPPIFVIGHWRTGTTLLHELLTQDLRFGYPNNYACFAPNHFVISEELLSPYFWFLLPTRRPMDNMSMTYDRPQEDEFALCLLGAGSPYEMLAFPNRRPSGQEFLDLADVTPRQLRRWQRTFVSFLRAVAYKTGKPLVLKSPSHAARIAMLLRIFPGARFVHIPGDAHRHDEFGADLFSGPAAGRRRTAPGQVCRVPPHEAACGQFRSGLPAQPARRLPRAIAQGRRCARAAP